VRKGADDSIHSPCLGLFMVLGFAGNPGERPEAEEHAW
jgi:hypothetical protein